MNEIRITGNTIQYYCICKRKVWLSVRQIDPDEDNPHLEFGRFVSRSVYPRHKKEIKLENIIIDLSRLEDSKIIVGEVKKSSRAAHAARMQLCYYLYVLKEYGIEAEGELLFPKEKKKEKVSLTDEVIKELEDAMEDIRNIASEEIPPPPVKIGYCTNCAYREFCWC
ncbi:MAG TPA: CRISPR-associated protein Cas4 [Thermodesulfobacteriota bacterium]|nr:CRISPR-associated protein Cas4 [Thermodesulfobacteriota bacterium]